MSKFTLYKDHICNIFDSDVFFVCFVLFSFFGLFSNFLSSILHIQIFVFGSVTKRDTLCLFSSFGGQIVTGLHSFACHLSRLHYCQILFGEWFGSNIQLYLLVYFNGNIVIVLKRDQDFQLFWHKFYSCTYFLCTTSLDPNMR